jgi:hypothetical protein
VPRPLLITLSIAITVLTLDVISCLWYFDSAIDMTIVAIDIAIIALLAFVHRRNAVVVDWAKSLALISGVVSITMVLLDIPLELPETYLEVQSLLEGPAMLALFFTMKLSPSRAYFLAHSLPAQPLQGGGLRG